VSSVIPYFIILGRPQFLVPLTHGRRVKQFQNAGSGGTNFYVILRTYFIAVNCFQRGKTRGAVSTMVEVTEGAGKGADPSNTSKTTMDYKTE
jgi:hypothetical protein